MNKIKLAIVDDEKLIRESLKIILGSSKEIEIAGLCENGEEAFNLCKETNVDVMLMDIRMPICDGVKATKLIKEAYSGVKIIILTTFKDDDYIFDAIKYGASGYILKDTSHEVILHTIKSAYIGNIIMNPEIATAIIENKTMDKSKALDKVKNTYNLTSRELEIITEISEGFTNKEIGERLFITEGTVKNNITEILSKLELRDRTQIAIFAFKNNLI